MSDNALEFSISAGLIYDMQYRPADVHSVQSAQCLELNGSEICFLAEECLELGRALEIKVCSGSGGPHLMTAFIEVLKVEQQVRGIYKVLAAIRTLKG